MTGSGGRTPVRVAEPLSDGFITAVGERLARGQHVRRFLPEKGRLHIDRPLPFLCVFRTPGERSGDLSGRAMVRGEGSYLIAPGGMEWDERVSALVETVVRTQADALGAFLLLEIWIGPPDSQVFRVVTAPQRPDGPHQEPTTIAVLVEALRQNTQPGVRLTTPDKRAEAQPGITAPPGFPPLLTTSEVEKQGCLVLGLEIPPLHRSDEGVLLPLVLRRLQAQLSLALRKAFFDFARVQSSHQPPHYQALGRRAVVRAVWDADRELASLDSAFDFLLSVTPVNSEEAWSEFEQSGFERTPTFHYRLLPIDPDRLKRRLHNIALQGIEDTTLGHLFREKRRELDRQITLIEDRDTPAFLGGSLSLYGDVSDDLFAEAECILRNVSREPVRENGDNLDASAITERAQKEIDFYRAQLPSLDAQVQIRSDIPGVMVSGGNLLVGQRARTAARRVDALMHHEIGTHILTRANGAAQPLKLLVRGLPNYDELQEGLAVLAEYLSGGLTKSRLRLLAARVIAVRCLTRGKTFPDVFHILHESHGFTPRTAFNITMRVFRGGGLTKDAVYLRGLLFVLRYLRAGNDTEALWIGKVGAEHLPMIEELRWREVLHPPPLRPRYLEEPEASARFAVLRSRETRLTELV
ncbi:MAG: flavohemoglobin expression-modulating QEGLA motif protein [Armatimonadota bacterium]